MSKSYESATSHWKVPWIFTTKILSMFYQSPFDYFFSPRVIVVTEEQLAAEKRRLKQAEVTRVESTIADYEASYKKDIAALNQRLESLQTELAALPGGDK